MTEKLTVSFFPHIRHKTTTSNIMLDVVIALVPTFIASVLIFGPRAALVTAVCVMACVGFEGIYQRLLGKPSTISDFSAVITGLLIAFNLPVTIPLWQAMFGCLVAIILVKQLYGGLGKNFANPAIVARVVMFLAFSGTMTAWYLPEHTPNWVLLTDTMASPTPLAILARGEMEYLPSMWHMFAGIRGGSIGETSALALLLGGAYLIIRRVITWHIPVTFIATVAVISFLSGGLSVDYMLFQMFAGGLFLGAIFMATDYVTSPQTSKGRIIFGVSCGLLTVVIRFFGSYPEGVSFAILFMNMLVPFINKLTLTKPLGGKKA